MANAGSVPQDHAAINQRLQGKFAELSPQLRQAARYVLDRPDEVALQSMRQLAANAGVNPATMVRLAKALDYPGFGAFREPFRERLRRPGATYSARVRALQARGGAAGREGALLAELLALDEENLRRTFETIGLDGLSACAEELAAARRIYVAGLRSCYPIAFYFHYACRLFRPEMTLIDGRGGALADGVRDIGPSDAMLAISLSPYTRDTVHVARYAKSRGARLVAMTDSQVSPLAVAADRTLVVFSASPAAFQSLVGAVAVAQALAALLMLRDGERALTAVGESEALLHAFQAYWDEATPAPARRKRVGATLARPGTALP